MDRKTDWTRWKKLAREGLAWDRKRREKSNKFEIRPNRV